MVTHYRVCMMVALCCLALCSVARAEHSASVRLVNTFVADPAFGLLSEDELMSEVELSYAYKVARLPRRSGLWVEGVFLTGTAGSKLFADRMDSESRTLSFLVGARYTLPITSWLVPTARIGFGLQAARLSLEPNGYSAKPVQDWAVAFTGQALVGIELLIPRVWFFELVTGGLVVEGGYSFCSDLGFELAPKTNPELRLIPLQGIDFGSLNTSGGQLRVGLVIRI